MSENTPIPSRHELIEEFDYFLRRLPEVVIADTEITRRVLRREGLNRDLVEYFLVWVAMSILISFLVSTDKAQQGKAARVI